MANGDVIIKFSADDKVTPAIQKQIDEIKKLKKEYNSLELSLKNLKADKSRIVNLDIDSDIASIKKLQKELRELKEQYITSDSKSKAREAIKAKQRELTAAITKEINKQTIALKRQKETIKNNETALKKEVAQRNKSTIATHREKNAIDKSNVSRKKENAIRRSATNALIRHIRQVESLVVAYYATSRIIDATATKGIMLNKTIEDGTVGIAALIAANTEGGNSAERFSAAMAISADTVLDLKKASVDTAATFPQLTQVFQQAIGGAMGAGKAMGATVDEVIDNTIKLSKRMTNIAASIGMPMDQVNQEIRAIMEGTITKDARIAKMLGITTKDIDEAKQNVNGLFNYLEDKLKVFDVLEEHITFTKLVARFSEALDTIRMEANKPIFEGLKLSIDDATIYLNKHQDEIIRKYHNIVKEAISGAGFIVDAFSGVTLVVREIELGFHYLVKGIAETMNFSTRMFNSFLKFKNKIAEFTGGERSTLYTPRDISIVDNSIEETKKQIDDLTKSLHNGRDVSEVFLKNINKALHPDNFQQWKNLRKIDVELNLKTDTTIAKIEKFRQDADKTLSLTPRLDKLNERYEPVFKKLETLSKDTNKNIADKAKATAILVRKAYEKELAELLQNKENIILSPKFKTWESLRTIDDKDIKQIEETLSKQRDQYIAYYDTIGDYAKEWALREEKLRDENSALTEKELKKLLSIEKTKFYDKKYKLAEDNAKKEAKLAKKAQLEYLRLYGSVSDGIAYQIQAYQDTLPTAFENGVDLMKTAYTSLDAGFTDFFDRQSDNFLDFGKLGKKILNDLANQMIKTEIVQPLSSAGSTLIGSVTGSFMDSLFDGWADGGYTYQAPSDRVPVGVVHANEYVIPAWMVKKHPSLVQGLEAERRGLKGFDVGGLASGSDADMDAAEAIGEAVADGDYSGGYSAPTVTHMPDTYINATTSEQLNTKGYVDSALYGLQSSYYEATTEVSIDGSSILGKTIGSLIGGIFGPLGSVIGGKLGGKLGEKLAPGSTTLVSGKSVDELRQEDINDLVSDIDEVSITTGAQTTATKQAFREIGDLFSENDNGGDGSIFGGLSIDEITKTIDEITQTLSDAYKTDTISAMSDIWDDMIGTIPDIKDDATAKWNALFSAYLEQGNKALLKTVLDGSVFDTPNFYKHWEEYAKSLNKSVADALSKSLSDMDSFKYDYTTFLLKDSPDELAKYEYDYYQNIAEKMANSIGVDFASLTKTNFLEKMDNAIAKDFTPETISNWEKLGDALKDAYEYEEKYLDTFENGTISHNDMMLPNMGDGSNTDLNALKDELKADNEETRVLFYEILKELKTQTSISQGLEP